MIPIFSILFAIILSHSLFAQEFPRMERLTTEQGLSQNMVFRIFQDREGFLWFGTRDGLNRYDGYNFMVFRHDPLDATSLPWASVMGIAEDVWGNIWLSTHEGLCWLDRRTAKFARVPHGPENSVVLSLQGDNAGNMWVGTSHGLMQYDTRSGITKLFCANPNDPSQLYHDSIMSLYMDKAGTLWISTVGTYLHRYNPGSRNFTRFNLGLPAKDIVYCVGEDSRGNIYCASYLAASGIIAVGFDPITRTVINRIINRDNREIYDYLSMREPMGIDASDRLWIQVKSLEPAQPIITRTTLLRISLQGDGEETIVQTPADHPIDRVWKMMPDRSGVFWLGTENGVVKILLDKPRFRTYRNIPNDPTSLSDDRVRGIYKDRHGTLWVGTDNGLNRMDAGSEGWVHYLYNPYKSRAVVGNVINTIFEDTDGTLFIGTNEGFRIYDRRTNTLSDGYARDHPAYQVWSFCRDGSGMLWVGTRIHGIYIYDRNGIQQKQFHPTTYGGGAPSANPGLIWDMHRDRYNIIWLATSIGLYRWIPEKDTFRKYTTNSSDRSRLSEASVCAIMEDSCGVLWFSTHGGGVNRYNRNSDDFTYITSHDGLPSNALYGTLMDDAGKLWISSNTGLASYNPATRSCRIYNSDDGLQSNEFSFKSFHKTSDGEMIFGGIHGLSMFHPDSLRMSTKEAPIVITEFRVFDKIVSHELLDGDTLEITHDQSFISFEFAMLDYVNPASIRYAYRMTGFDNDWIYCSDRRYTSFTNLDPGTYTFMVKATNSDGVWNTRPLRIFLKVIPPFWMTWWFKGTIIAGMILVAGAGGILWIRSIRGKEMLQRRSVESQLQALRLQVNPHFIFNALSSIQHLILIAERKRAVDYLSRFARLIGGILDNSERTSIPLADEIESLRNYLDLEMFRFEGRLKYVIDIDTGLDTQHILIPSMIIQPCVENAIRHGLLHKPGMGHLEINITGHDDLIHCSIQDDGVGRQRAMELRRANGYGGHSMGIRVTEERLNILNAISLKRKPISMNITDLRDHQGNPTGTRVELLIPVEPI